eukprot:tig00021314_g20125.t1
MNASAGLIALKPRFVDFSQPFSIPVSQPLTVGHGQSLAIGHSNTVSKPGFHCRHTDSVALAYRAAPRFRYRSYSDASCNACS